MATIGNCNECALPIRKLQQKLICMECDKKYHRTCVEGVTQEDYRKWKKEDQLETWKCCECKDRIQVKALPSAPLGPLVVNAIGQHSVVLAWEPPSDSGNAHWLKYDVAYRKKNGSMCEVDSEDMKKIYAGVLVTYEIQSLLPGTEYQFFVRAKNIKGESDYLVSESFVKTHSVCPREGPPSVRLESCGADQTKVSWTLLSAETASVDKYVIKVSVDSNNWETVAETQDCVTDSIVITNQIIGTHWIGVAAVNDAGTGPLTTVQNEVTALPSAPLGPLIVNAIGQHSVVLAWEPPSDSGNCHWLKYDVAYRKKNGSMCEVDSEDMKKMYADLLVTYEIQSLLPGTEYQFFVRAKNINGESNYLASETFVKTHSVCPHEGPPSVKVEPRGPDQTKVSWTLLSAETASVDKYVIKASVDSNNWETVAETKDCVTDSIVITNQLTSTHWIGVAAVNDAGTGPLTTVQNIVKAPPSSPLGPLAVAAIDHHSVVLTWKPPSNSGNCYWLEYEVAYTKQNNSMCEVDSKDMMRKPHIRADSLVQYEIQSLLPGTEYWFFVRAKNIKGVSEYLASETFVKTKNICPCEGPPSVRLESYPPDKTKVSWTLLSAKTAIVDKYVIKASVDSNSWETVTETKDCVTDSIVITNQLSSTHWIGVAAMNDAGTGPLTTVQNKVKEPEVPGMTKRQKTAKPYDMPDLPLFKVIKELIKTKPVECDFSSQKCRDIFKLQAEHFGKLSHIWFVRRKNPESKHWSKGPSEPDIDEMPRHLQSIHVNVTKVWPKDTSIDLTKKRKFPAEPIDITAACIGRDNYVYIWALTKHAAELKNYCFCVRLVEELTSQQVCEKLAKECLRPAEHTCNAVEAQLGGDADCEIAATSVHASLQCPIAKIRLQYPCRSKFCSHIQCLDAVTMVCMNAKKAKWSCQICSVSCSYEDLYIDGLFMEILNTVPVTTSEVEFKKDGTWTYKGDKSDKSDREEETSIIELDLSKTLEMIDLTETDDESSPKRKPSTSSIKKREPLKTNTFLQNTGSSESRRQKLGENYQSSNLSSCHRNQNRNTNNGSRSWRQGPYERNRNRHNLHSQRWYNGGSSVRNRDWRGNYITSYRDYDNPSDHYQTSTYFNRYQYTQSYIDRRY